MINLIQTCLTCGHHGDKENPLAVQGNYTVPYCHSCLLSAENAAAETIANSEWFIDWNNEKEEKEE